ncbi:MAG: hypothetical protein RIQ72_609 [Candidatus Parcubacteria bacterium]|jgi:hypothetical protein
MQDYSEVKSLLATQIQAILSRRHLIATVTIGTVHETGEHKEVAEIGTRLTIVKNQVRGLIRYNNWSAIFHLHQTTATEPKHLRTQFQLAASGEAKVAKKRVKKTVKRKASPQVSPAEDVDFSDASSGPKTQPVIAAEAPLVVVKVDPKPYSPVLLGKHRLPLLEILTSFVLLAGDIGGTIGTKGACRAIADTLSGSDREIEARSLSPLLRSLVKQGILGTRGVNYYLTPFGQLIYVVLSNGAHKPGEIDWGKVLSNEKLDLSDVSERRPIFAVMASEQVSHFTIAQLRVAEEVEKLNRQLKAAKRRQTAANATLSQPMKFAKNADALAGWRHAIANALGDHTEVQQ